MKKLELLLIFSFITTSIVTANGRICNREEALEVADSSVHRSSTLSGRKTSKGATLEWSIQPLEELKQIDIQFSSDGSSFNTVHHLKPQQTSYDDVWPTNRGSAHYRLALLWNNGNTTFTSSIQVAGTVQSASIVLLTNPITDLAKVKIANPVAQPFAAEWRNAQGVFMVSQTFKVSAGVNTIQLAIPSEITPGTYYLRIMSDDKKYRQLFRIVKQ